jgi:hypothetical protein
MGLEGTEDEGLGNGMGNDDDEARRTSGGVDDNRDRGTKESGIRDDELKLPNIMD